MNRSHDELCIQEREFKDHCRGFVEVTTDTIGQFTDLRDKNGVKIFEGDICEVRKVSYCRRYLQTDDMTHESIYRCECVFENGIYSLVYKYKNKRGEIKKKFFGFKDCVVVGNIHDQPELLKEA